MIVYGFIMILTVSLIIILTLYTIITYKPVNSETFGYDAPSRKSVYLITVIISLWIFTGYLINIQETIL